ncbi:hypothetical protein TNCT_641351 [Trichonephila clavata]|uniref:Uncharacterized protein n=1 Tax=Trichonephila clavata TaxID=2740835 RepID=A0A8X6LPB2_TRICU|nr:hypothetical protein TNCT_641351 [Trichonephila clavata]
MTKSSNINKKSIKLKERENVFQSLSVSRMSIHVIYFQMCEVKEHKKLNESQVRAATVLEEMTESSNTSSKILKTKENGKYRWRVGDLRIFYNGKKLVSV